MNQEQTNRNVGVSHGNITIKIVVNNIMDQTTKPELEHYFYATLFTPETKILVKAIKKGFLKTFPDPTGGLTKKHIDKWINTTMGNLHTR